MIICAQYKKNPTRTVDATEWTWFSKSMWNDLEDIGQGQGSSHATHPLMLLIICTKYGKNPSWTVDATERTWDAGRTDVYSEIDCIIGQTDGVKPIYPPTTSLCGGYNDGILLIGPMGTNFSEILIGILTFSFKKIHLKVSSAKWQPFCLGLNMLRESNMDSVARLPSRQQDIVNP